MGVPKQKHTKSRRDKRRMHIFIKPTGLTICPKCGQKALPHTVCGNCGYYKGREVIDVMKRLNRKEKKEKEREIAGQETKAAENKPLSAEGLSKK
jgi:large subunit ribosomal protein L32